MADWPAAADRELMEATARGDRDAFAALIRRHQPRVLSIAFRFLGDKAEAEDAAQEVFLRLWRSAGRYRPDKALEAYLRTLTVNFCLDVRRKARLFVVGTDEDPAGPQDPQRDAGDAERREALDRALLSLPPAQRMAVVLFHMEGLSVREAAALLEVSPKAVESLLSRARTALRERLSGLL